MRIKYLVQGSVIALAASHDGKTEPIANILVVDDELDIVAMIKRGLQQSNFLVSAFTNPIMALDNFSQHPTDYCMIVADIRMPQMTGFELVRKARKLNPDIKIVLMTAFEINESEFSRVLPSTKVDDFIRKPMPISLLTSVILKHIGNTEPA